MSWNSNASFVNSGKEPVGDDFFGGVAEIILDSLLPDLVPNVGVNLERDNNIYKEG